MGQKKRTEQLVLNIGIALTAGMFSIVPVAYGAPVSDGVKTAGVAIDQVAAATAGAVDTNITSTAPNNVIGWHDFSVAKGERVNFNDDHNYLNIVSGQNTSQIDGAINSQGGNIYLVNPNGVIIGKGASINVGTAGSFNVSTRYLDSATAKESVAAGKAISTVIQDASSTVASDIVNMGSIAAKSVVLEGNNIRFMDSGATDNKVNVTNDDISFKSSATGYVHIGNSTGTGVSGYKVNGTNNDSLTPEQKKNTYYQLIDSMSGITNAGGNYMLSKDITSASGYSGTFTGKFDGMGFTINGFTANNGGGLFQATQGALIENLGVTNINISDPQDNGAGGIIGTASSGTVLRNVYSTGLIQNGSTVGGLVGNANGVTIDHSYSSVTITSGEGAGIIGYVASGTNKISNSYFNGSAAYGFIGDSATYSNSNKLSAEVTNSYAISQSGPYFQPKTGLTIVNSLVKDTSHNKLQKYTTAGATSTEETYSDSIMNRQKYYSDLGWDISNTGGVKVDGNGAVTHPTWRIYEGQAAPILTSMTKGIKTVSYNYGYFKADGSLDTKASVRNAVSGQSGIGSNGRADMPAYNETSQPTGLVYNGETLKIVDKNNNALTATTANDASVFIKTEGKSTVAASDIKYNTSGQKNSTYEAISSTQGTQNTLAMVWSNQQGYDLVGGNVSIAPRTIKAITDYSSTPITKQYDGKADASEAFKNLFSGNSTTTTGILAVDKDAVTVAFSGSASFVDSNGNADASVGKGKDIKFGSNSSIGLAFADNSAGNAAKNNYILNTAGMNFNSGMVLTGVGTITQRDLVIGFNSSFYSGGTAINRDYDGTTTAAAATDNTFTLTGIVTPEGSNKKDKVSVDISSATANYIDGTGTATKKAGAHAVRYSGLKLTDDDAKNYRLVDANGDVLYSEAYNGVGADVNKETGGYLDGAGTIAKKNISLGGFSVNGAGQGAEKTYDNTEYYDGALGQKVYSDEVVHNADKTVWDDLTFTVTNDTNGHSGYFTEQEGSTTHVTDADTGYGVGYHVTIGGSDADNYTINGAAITNGSTAEVTGSGGTIKKRVITLALGNTTSDIDKTYDGDKLVKVTHNNQLTSDIALSDGLVKYADGSNQLIATDGTKLSIKGEYDSENVAKSNTYGIGADQGIKYTVSVVDGTISGKASNYVFKTQGGEATQTITGATGAINPVHIKNIQFNNVSKTYDGSEMVKGEQTSDVISVTGITDGTKSVLVGDEQLSSIIDTNRIIGTYGSGNTDATFAKNAHVQRDNHNAVIAGTVKYTGKDTAGAAASLKNSIISDNYALDIDSEYGKGTINPLTISDMDKLQLAHGNITKAYDGNDSVAYKDAQGVNHTANEFVNTLSTTVGNTQLTFDYTVGDAYYADANVARDGSGNAIKKDVTYKLKVTENGDYAIAAGLKDSNGYVTKVFQTANNDGGIITPRKLKAQAAASGFTKTYDATNVVYDGTTPLSGNGVVTFVGYDNAADGLLTQDQSANNSSAVYDNVDAGKGKAINYTAKIGTGSDAIANNYDIYVSNDNTNWTKGTSFTANNGVINKAGLQVTFDDVNKKYDGNAYLKDTYNNDASLISPNYHGGIKSRGDKADEVYVSFASQDDSVFDSADVARANGQVTSQNVTYKFTLEGAQAGNYFIADAHGNEVTTKEGEKTILNGRGTISPKNLTDADVTLNFDAVNKVYDTNSNISYNHSAADYGDQAGSQDAADYINQFIIGGVVLKNGQTDTKGENYSAAGIYLNSAGTETSGVDANKAKFTITLTDKAVSNFDLSSVSFYNSTAKTLTKTTDAGTASITPKNVTVSFHEPEVTKVYNGKTDVAIGTNILNVSGIISGDKAELDRDNVNARYADKNVAYDSAGKVTSKDVYYDAVLKGDNAANYKLVYGTKGSTLVSGKPSLTITGKGTITPKEISADFNYDGNVAAAAYNTKAGDTIANKAYDATDKVNNLDSKIINGVNGEVIKLKDSDIKGTYGKWTADASGAETGIGADGQTEKGSFTANGDVNWLGTGSTEDEKTGYKAVKYTGLQQALENATDANNASGFSGKNYTIANTVYFTEAAKKGKIRQLALTADDIKTKWTTITKEYDGTDVVQNAEKHLGLYTDVTGSNINIKYKLQYAVYDKGQVNVVSGHGVTYTLNDLESQEFTNFKMDSAMLTSFKNKTYTTTGSITPRVLKIKTDNLSGYTKTYDGDTTVKDANGNIINSFDYTFEDGHGILDKDNTVNLTVTGAYQDKDANVDPDSTAKAGKQINYTLELTGNTAGNYTLDSSKTTKGDAVETDADTYKGDGAIKKRVVYADFADGYGTGIDKPYDGTASADADKKQRNHINLLDGTDENTGIIAKEKNSITLLADSINAAYAAKDVARDAKGNVTTQDVYFSNFQLDGATKDNYVVKAKGGSDKLTGSGTITPLTVNVSVKEGPVKEYDRDASITGKYIDAANINVDTTNVIGNDTVGVFIKSGSCSYTDWNAGDNKDYTYQLGWTNGNYELADTAAGESLTTKGMTAALTGHNGKIEKRLLTVKDVKRANKVYDGTEGVENAADNIVLDDRIIAGDNIGLEVSGTYDNEDAAASEDTDALLDHNVSYTLSVGNANYQLDKTSADGKGTIRRKGLDIVAKPQKINVGEAIPTFTGSVTGLVAKDSSLASGFTFAPKDETEISNSIPGKYGVYGWYKGKLAGNLDKNYTFSQNPGNEEAFVVNMVDPGREYHDTVNPKGQFRPDMTAYQQASEDTIGGFNAGSRTALEYRDVNGAVIGTLAIDNGDINQVTAGSEFLEQENKNRRANIGIAGADIVNMNGVDAASSASVDVDGDGSVVNLEIESIVPVNMLEADTIVRDDDKDGEIAIEQIGNKDEEKKNSKSIGVETTGAGVNMAS
ncbi:filamentous hemagglutinin N-terminal domain-containing protein [Selenomonas caprae]|uniref:Filamentous hemagglutinin N-terminal domain-containing protein n=1 Tax=Selenomonas caprae TaxID=2606905 RepID=A0A5D6WKA2_9FIRM|nr:YDG domain-containing protein [Selenomonas caprae]TYZ29011.1 filamentous hemagglutinin N-terminal domain-containing protein [Selenomonas caprae]